LTGVGSVEWNAFAVVMSTCFHEASANQRLKNALEAALVEPDAISWSELREFTGYVAPHLRFGGVIEREIDDAFHAMHKGVFDRVNVSQILRSSLGQKMSKWLLELNVKTEEAISTAMEVWSYSLRVLNPKITLTLNPNCRPP